MKILFILVSSIVVFLMFIALGIFGILYFVKDDKDFCLDSGICKEGLKLNTEHGKITISRENCKKYHWVWNEEQSTCFIK